uniref:Uncharacterized protein n=1 Tax=Clandestinovirus TaxID=2831644 RepID=A0A8F8KR33_9VIRU|nr:hypothetical protein KOM_12_350 [Clandestinovirus]
MNKSVESLCEGKFAPLAQYFDSAITVQDLNDLDVDDIVECVDNKHKLLAKIFWSSILSNILDNPDPFYSVESNNADDSINNFSEDVLSFRDRIVSSKVPENSLPNYLYRIDLLPNHLKQRPNLDKCKVLDLSRNNLTCHDGQYIVECAKVVPNCVFVDLKVNRLSDCLAPVAWLFDLAKLEHVQYIRVTQNVLATIESNEFWKIVRESTDDHKNILLEKLIWVDEYWIAKNGGWQKMIDPEFINVVKSVHDKFYRQWSEW